MNTGIRFLFIGLSLSVFLALAACGGGGSSSSTGGTGSGSNGSGSGGSSNSAPVASNGSVTTTAGSAVSGTLAASDTDGDTLTFSIVTNPGHGTVSITNAATGAFTYTPSSGYTGSDSFTFKATDSAGNASNTATESVTVNTGSGGSGNSAPVASNGSVTTTADSAVSGTLAASDTDGDTLSFSIVTNPGHGTVNITNTATGAFTYTPSSGYTGSDSFTFKAADSLGNVSNTATESITINDSLPGAPTLNGVTAGSGSIELSFTAPTSDGGSSITSYTATCTAAGNTDFSASGTASPITVTGMNGGVTRSCTVAAANSVGTGAASNALSDTPTSLAPEDLTHLPLGDTLSTTSVPTKIGYLYVCSVTSGGGASAKGPWFNSDGTTWDETKKLAVQGSNTMSSTFSYTVSGNTMTVSGNDIPSHPVGTFPIAQSDPVHQYDGNPNSISSSDTISWSLPANPTVASTPSCTQGTIGFLVTGARLFNAVDAGDRDAVAWEGQDSCDGHPNSSGAYHYHDVTEQDCLPASAQDVAGQHSPVVGYAADGFPIYGNLGQDGVPLSDADLDICHGHTHAITFNGKTVVMYHYHATHAFPYTVGCYRGTPKHIQ